MHVEKHIIILKELAAELTEDKNRFFLMACNQFLIYDCPSFKGTL